MWGKSSDMRIHERDPFNAEAPEAALAETVTAIESFYVRNHGPVPELDDGWRLMVRGLVGQELVLALDDLRRRPQHTVTATLQCAGNRRAGFLPVRDIPEEAPWGPGATSTAVWSGVRLADLLREAGVAAQARHICFEAPDVSDLADPPQPFGGSIPLAVALGDDVLVALTMNGEDLPPVHGGPARIVVPGHVGARSVKWVESITAQHDESDNFFQTTAYRLLPPDAQPAPGAGVELSSVAQNCAILTPTSDEALPAGEVSVSGYAMAGDDRVVVRVDVSADDGDTWTQATVSQAASPHAWVHWTAQVTLTAGKNVLVARCWDSTGALQAESAASLWNPKGYVNNSWDRITVRGIQGS